MQATLQGKIVHVVTDRTAVNTSLIQIYFANTFFEKFVIFTFLTYLRLGFLKTFFSKCMLKKPRIQFQCKIHKSIALFQKVRREPIFFVSEVASFTFLFLAFLLILESIATRFATWSEKRGKTSPYNIAAVIQHKRP